MDLTGSGDVAVKHFFTLENPKIVHELRLSSSFVPVAKEVRKCVFVIAGAWALARIANLVLRHRTKKSSDPKS